LSFLRLSSIGNELMVFFLYNTLGHVLHLLVIQVIFLQVLSMKCYISTGFHFVDSICYHSNNFVKLQVFKFKSVKYKFFNIKLKCQ
jgi:hypothetical protein